MRVEENKAVESIRLASKRDIAAMKINAITNRGTRKDFYDLYELLKEFNLREIINSYQQKYNVENLGIVLRSLIYFLDADNDNERNNKIISLRGEKWEDIKREIEDKYNDLFMNS